MFCFFCFQELVSDEQIGHTQPVFQFLCPLDKLLNEEENGGGVWGLLSGLAYLLTPGQEELEEEEVTSPLLFGKIQSHESPPRMFEFLNPEERLKMQC